MSGEKTEDPTEKRKRDSRKKGQVAQSKDFVMACGMAATFAYFMIQWDSLLNQMSEFLDYVTIVYTTPFDEALGLATEAFYKLLLTVIGPFLALSLLSVLLPGYMSVGFLFSLEPVMPKMEKLSPVSGVKKIFNMKNLLEFIKSLLKLSILIVTSYLVVTGAMQSIMWIPVCGKECLRAVFRQSVFELSVVTLVVFLVIGVIDLKLQQALHNKSLKMSKDEVKREYKQSEGDPMIKGQRKQIGREIVEKGAKMSEACMVIFGGGAVVALKYVAGETPLPQVIGKGQDDTVRMLLAKARKAGVPLVSDPKLARDIFSNVPNGEFITSEYVGPVAQHLARNKV
ncbi:EscU/YscU/HrcU family type III secretion system export apparatus switch protein [Aestuariispira insulae]|uniref:Type III secretion protein U n=1 Tax=Aestuariispira insulae TaxID=1461337 RepID=A0A3D9H2L1_9PROT|nr:EscU/YscU/HrcU family type III secretion system export apparatus switch protein [Aestuariispira insulae]RED43739.1 type III secretion protein U [Aestuariispira insulae]